jgi:hypothetical protein
MQQKSHPLAKAAPLPMAAIYCARHQLPINGRTLRATWRAVSEAATSTFSLNGL